MPLPPSFLGGCSPPLPLLPLSVSSRGVRLSLETSVLSLFSRALQVFPAWKGEGRGLLHFSLLSPTFLPFLPPLPSPHLLYHCQRRTKEASAIRFPFSFPPLPSFPFLFHPLLSLSWKNVTRLRLTGSLLAFVSLLCRCLGAKGVLPPCLISSSLYYGFLDMDGSLFSSSMPRRHKVSLDKSGERMAWPYGFK